MILGIDVGYNYTKIVGEKIKDKFLSTVKSNIIDVNGGGMVIEFEGKKHLIGSTEGKLSTEINKIHDETFRLCLYTAIAKHMKNDKENIQLVTGLPVGYFQGQKDELLEELAGLTKTINFKGKEKTFTITEVIVVPEGAAIFMLSPDDFKNKNLVIDIGGETTDVSLFDGMVPVDYKTYPKSGVLSLYDSIAQRINGEKSVGYSKLDMEEICESKKIIKFERNKDEVIDVSDIVNEEIKNHVDTLMSNIQGSFKAFAQVPRIYVGGGCYPLQKELGIKVQKDNIFANAQAYYEVGRESFES